MRAVGLANAAGGRHDGGRWHGTETTTRLASTASPHRASTSMAKPTSSAACRLRLTRCSTPAAAREGSRWSWRDEVSTSSESTSIRRCWRRPADVLRRSSSSSRTWTGWSWAGGSTWCSWQATSSCSRRRGRSEGSCSDVLDTSRALVRSSPASNSTEATDSAPTTPTAASPALGWPNGGPRGTGDRSTRRRRRPGVYAVSVYRPLLAGASSPTGSTFSSQNLPPEKIVSGRNLSGRQVQNKFSTSPRLLPDPERCELCEAGHLTTWYHEDEICWIADCEMCAVPMVVWKLTRGDTSRRRSRPHDRRARPGGEGAVRRRRIHRRPGDAADQDPLPCPRTDRKWWHRRFNAWSGDDLARPPACRT